MMHLPSELEAMAVIPALRSMLARELLSKGAMNQTQVAALLGITQAAVSNYMTGARGKDAQYLNDPEIRVRVSILASLLDARPDSRTVARGLTDLTEFIRKHRLMCVIHKEVDPDLDVDTCHICDG
ncbi:MAG: hypothetical protein KIY12_04505 [Thermoplasmata archaeon]|uniref:HTH cro/C1-type domain-containing protein n=1 Tax=Candidatus Sysuiplasma superficiale TaxID=2823368 RepID=A0A8J7YJ02_9ARCH|nr:hypothetical protein [Candidatus Sysuiplasma superficiale]MBX8643968.1 hypothetical protein [Candidatus Sysuiplasma superficiale]MCL4346895.1 hypothetical protein [Candidatus Thermoplasmatota archaeon]